MWYVYEGTSDFIMLSVDDVKKLINMNRKRQPIDNLEAFQIKVEPKPNPNI